MSAANNSSFTRGAQLWAHNVRMIMQGTKNICLFGLAFVVILIVIRVVQNLTVEAVYYFLIERYVQIKLSIGVFFYGKGQIGIDFYSLNKGIFVHKEAEQFIYQFWYPTPYGVVMDSFINWAKQKALFKIFIIFTLGCSIALLLFTYRGRNILGVKELRGSDLVTVKELRRILVRVRQASKVRISGLPIVKDSETQHLLHK